jgi:hypothetical protein
MVNISLGAVYPLPNTYRGTMINPAATVVARSKKWRREVFDIFFFPKYKFFSQINKSYRNNSGAETIRLG